MINFVTKNLCPECGRALCSWDDTYLCTYCWLLLTEEKTKINPHKDGICAMIEKECGMGLWHSCLRCGKALLIRWDKIEEFKKQFNPQSVEEKRQKKLKSDKEIEDRVLALRLRDKQIKEAMEQAMKQGWYPVQTG